MSYLSIKSSEKASQSLIDRYYLNFTNDYVVFGEEDTEQSITERFEQQVSKYKYATAIKTKNATISYDELNSRANRLARTIISQRGEGKEIVALLLEQGSDFITGIFGVLKTGRFYVPIDPSLPMNRLTSIIEDSGTSLIVTNNRNQRLVESLARPELILNLDDIDTSLCSDNLGLSISPDTPAYVIYTSGSTGKPKGVLQNHRNALHNCMNNTNALCIRNSDRLTLLHSCGVMGAMRGICNALLNGASLYPFNVKEEGLTNLIKLLVLEEITIYHSVATLFRHLVSSKDVLQFPKLRALILGGEQVLQRDIELYKQHFSASCVVYVSLGSTETGTVRQFVVNKHTPIHTSTVPIGYGVEGMEIMLLDETGAEVESGCIGEIAVKSKYLALGYWQNPELTSAKFFTDPNGSDERIYRTGDLGRFEPDGCLIHMGRKDFQVKIRGFRIEISEIEMALLNTGVVKEVVVTARDKESHDKCLVAYVVLAENKVITANELRVQLQDKLPDYMLPSAFVFLDALPLTPNSKVNRLALPAPEVNQLESNSEFVAARNHTEHKLVEIWEKALGVHPIGIKHNFFDLGGHSLLAVQIFGQIEKQFNKKLPLATLLQAGTIEALATILTEQTTLEEKISWSSLVKIQPNGAKPPLFLMHPLGGEILIYRKLSMYLGFDQPVYGLQPVGLDGNSPYTKVEDMAAHYIREMQIIQPHGPYLLGGYSFGGIIAFEIAQQLLKRGEEVAFLFMLDTCRPGYSARLSLLERIPIHLKKLIHQPKYILQKIIGMKTWSQFHLREKYKCYSKMAHNFIQIALDLPESDEHLNILQANAIALSQYCFQQKYPGQLTLFRTADENRDDDAVGVKYHPEFGWTDLFTEPINIHHIPGSHVTICDEPHIEVIAQKLKASLARLPIL